MQTSLTDQLLEKEEVSLTDQLISKDVSLTDQLMQPEISYNFQPPPNAAPYLESITAAETKYGLPKNLLPVLINTESNFNPEAISPKGAVGLAQIVSKHHPDVDPTDPEASIDYSAKYLRQLYDRFGDWDKAIAAYNTGPGNVRKNWPDKLPTETRNYLEKINQFRQTGQAPIDKPKPPVKREVPESETDPGRFYSSNAFSHYGVVSPATTAYMGMKGVGPQPEGGFNEMGVPLNAEGKPYIESGNVPNAIGGVIAETLQGFETLAMHPMETIRGGLDFALSLPGFITGLLSATGAASKELLDQVVIGQTLDLERVYDKAAESMGKTMEYFEPTKQAMIGEPTAESQLATQVIMAPLTAMSMLGHKVADNEMFADSPNIRGAARFAGDIAGLAVMGVLLHGPNARKQFAKEAENITKRADDITKKQEAVNNIPDELVRKLQEKILAAEKRALELEAQKLAKKVSEEAMIREEIGRMEEANARAKVFPVQETGLKFPEPPKPVKPAKTAKAKAGARKKVKVEPKVEPKPEPVGPREVPYTEVKSEVHEIFDSLGIESKDVGRLKRLKKFDVTEHVVESGEPIKIPATWHDAVFRTTIMRDPEGNLHVGRGGSYDTILSEGHVAGAKEGAIPPGYTLYVLDMGGEGTVAQTRKLRIYRAKDATKKPKQIPIKEVDQATGVEVEGLKGENSPFYQNKETADTYAKLYAERAKAVMEDPELFAQKLINDVNRWNNGDKSIDIAKTRDNLSTLATRADELRADFLTGLDFLTWKETVSDAAAWARGLDRSKIEQTRVSPDVVRRRGPSQNQLNMMIPLNEIPSAVRNLWEDVKASKIPLSKLYRNKKVWEETGYWLGQEGMWRKEISDYIDIYNPKNKTRFLGNELNNKGRAKLTDVYRHDKLYEEVPELRKTDVQVDQSINTSGYYEQSTDTIVLKYASDRATLMHEIQHAVNKKVGSEFLGSNVEVQRVKIGRRILEKLKKEVTDPGIRKDIEDALTLHKAGRRADANKLLKDALAKADRVNPADKALIDEALTTPLREAFNEYRKDPGEMESRLTEERMGMSPSQRKKEAPWETLDKMLEGELSLDEWAITPYKKRIEPGHKLYSGDPVSDVAIKTIVAGARKVADYTKKARGMKQFKPTDAAKMVREEFNRAFIDRSGNIRLDLIEKLGYEGYKVVQKMYLSKGASSVSSNMLKQMQKEVYGGLTKGEKRVLDNLILAERMVDIGQYKTSKEFKFPEEIKPANSIAYLELFPQIEKLSAEQAMKLRDKAKAYFDWMKRPLQDMLDAGLISKDEFNALVSHNFRKIKLVDVYDKRGSVKVGKKKRTVYDSGVEALSKGRETDVFEPSSEIMALEVFNRAYGRILNNEANKALLDIARSHPDNPFVRVRAKKGDPIPSGWSRLFVHEEGQRKSIFVSPEMSKEWIVSNPEMSYRLGQLMRVASGSPVLRTFATGINWGFALANLPRDVHHIWFAAREYKDGKWKPIYNPVMPIYGLQMGRDLSAVFLDAATKGERYNSYIKEGGGMEFLVHQGRLMQRGRHLEGPIDKVYNFLGYFGETSEIMTRLAIRERVIRRRAREQGISMEEARNNKDITSEATFIARDYMDFGQGGGITKAADNALPYLNATVQGTRGMFRAFKPGSGSALSSTFKLAQFAALTTGIYIAAKKMHPKTMENLQGNIDAQNNLIIPLGDQFGFEDEQGQMRYPYLKIPIDPGQKFFKTFFEASADKWLGNEVDVNRVVDALKEQSPVGVTEMPPSISGALGYVTNKDFWLNEDIWTKTDKPFSYPNSKEEFIPGHTPQAYIDLGKATGISPERMRYAVEELTTNGTLWSHLLGEGYNALRGLEKEQKEQHLAMTLARTPVIKRFVGVTNPYSKHASKIEKAEEEAVLERWVQNRGMDMLVDGYLYEGSVAREEVIKYARSFKDKKINDRLIDRFKFETAIQNLPEKSFWKRLKGLDTETRAKMFVDRLRNSDETDKAQLWKEYGIIARTPGIISPEFRSQVRQQMGEE